MSRITAGPYLTVGGILCKDVSFTLGTSVRTNEKSILQFWFRSSKDASSLNYRIAINGKPITSYTVSGDHFGTMHEVVSGGVLKTGSNKVTLAIAGGTGSVRVTDIVVWLKREVSV